MEHFYFTYGSEGHPFKGGWTEIVAEDMNTAISIFEAVHPSAPGCACLNCSSVYDEKQFIRTGMNETGNIGAFAHETITIERHILKGENK